MPKLTVTEPALLIRIARLYRENMSPEELYEATRGVWKLGERARFAFAVARGIVKQVYSIHGWRPAGSLPYRTRPSEAVGIPGRWEFTGQVAPDAVRHKYLSRSVAHYFQHGNSFPVIYVNVPK